MSMWTLQTCEPSETGPLTFRLSAGAVKTVGRATRADFVLDAALVSRVHCRLSVTPTEPSKSKTCRAPTARGSTTSGWHGLQLAAGDRLRVGGSS